jgi:neuroligin
MKFWNEVFPEITSNNFTPHTVHKSPPPWILTNPPRKSTYIDKFENFHKPYNPTQGFIRVTGTSAPDNMVGNVVYGTVVKSPGEAPPLAPGPEPDSRGISTTVTIAMSSIFLLSNLLLFVVLYLTCYRKRKLRSAAQKNDEAPAGPDEENEAKLIDGCNLMKIVSRSERSDDTYEAVKSHRSCGKFKVPRQMSSSTIDAHTKVRDWITNEIVYKYSPRFLRRPRHGSDKSHEGKTHRNDNNSTLGRSPTRPVSPSDDHKNHRPPLVKSSSIPVQKSKKVQKVSVAIDATPSGRGPSVLAQQPIELTKSLDRPNFEGPLRRSLTMEDFSVIQPAAQKQELRKSTTSINLKYPSPEAPTVIRIEHAHSKSDPVQDFCSTKKLKTFDPNSDVNVTSRDETSPKVPLTPEESLMTIKRRNFPKVLPDYPSREALVKKRRSMPVANHLFTPIPEMPGQPQPHSPTSKIFGKLPPAPPLRTTSTLTRKVQNQTPPVCQSAPMLAQEPPPSPEPEVTCNNLYFGPLIPKLSKTELSSSESSRLNTQPIYDKLRAGGAADRGVGKSVAKTIITADPSNPIKKVEPKVIIKPTMARNVSDPKKHIPRVVLHDNLAEDEKSKSLLKPSQIPTLTKGSKESSSSESTPSEESDTGTVVKRLN